MSSRRTFLDRRHCFRFPINLETSFVPAGESISYSARVQNISRRGVKLLVDHRREPGTVLRVLLKTMVEARVVYAAPAIFDKWAMGCVFVQELSEEELQCTLNLPAECQGTSLSPISFGEPIS